MKLVEQKKSELKNLNDPKDHPEQKCENEEADGQIDCENTPLKNVEELELLEEMKETK